jgi:hypothetical protein
MFTDHHSSSVVRIFGRRCWPCPEDAAPDGAGKSFMPWIYKDVAPDGAGIRLGSVERGGPRGGTPRPTAADCGRCARPLSPAKGAWYRGWWLKSGASSGPGAIRRDAEWCDRDGRAPEVESSVSREEEPALYLDMAANYSKVRCAPARGGFDFLLDKRVSSRVELKHRTGRCDAAKVFPQADRPNRRAGGTG